MLITAVALVGVAGCGGGNDKATKGPTTTVSPALGNGKCVKKGKPLGTIDATDLASVVKAFDDLSDVPPAIRDDWKVIGAGYRQLQATVGDINLNPAPTDPTVVAAIRAMTSDAAFSAALQKVGTYCGIDVGG